MIPTPEEVADEIKMRRAQHGEPFLLVEGPSDVDFFSNITKLEIENIIPSFGWENLIEVMEILRSEGYRGIMGVIDLDYRDITGVSDIPQDIFLTDSHDIETMMFSSNAFNKVLRHKGSHRKIREYTNGGSGVRTKIIKLGQEIGCLRFHAQLCKNDHSFDRMGIENFIDKKSLLFSHGNFISHIRNINQKNCWMTGNTIHKARKDLRNFQVLADPFRLCCGHDLMEIMAIGLKSMWGTHDSLSISGEILEKSFILAYSTEMFAVTSLFKQMKRWFVDNGYPVAFINNETITQDTN